MESGKRGECNGALREKNGLFPVREQPRFLKTNDYDASFSAASA